MIDGIIFKIWKAIVLEIEQVLPALITQRRCNRRRTCIVSNLRRTEEVRFMDKICKRFLLIFACFLISTNGFANNPDTTKIPNLKLNNYKVKGLIKDLIKDGSIRDNDVLLINFIEEDNELYMRIVFSEKRRLFLLDASLECRTQKFMGYSKIFNHDCFVFGNKAERFFTKKDSVQLPDYFNWLLSINHMEIEDFFTKVLMENSDGDIQEVTMRVDNGGVLYKYVKKHFILIPYDSGPWKYRGRQISQ